MLEHEFSLLRKRLLRKDLFYATAAVFERFSEGQLRLILYMVSNMVSKMQRRCIRHHRKSMAAYLAVGT